jgi:hypothetical protein
MISIPARLMPSAKPPAPQKRSTARNDFLPLLLSGQGEVHRLSDGLIRNRVFYRSGRQASVFAGTEVARHAPRSGAAFVKVRIFLPFGAFFCGFQARPHSAENL